MMLDCFAEAEDKSASRSASRFAIASTTYASLAAAKPWKDLTCINLRQQVPLSRSPAHNAACKSSSGYLVHLSHRKIKQHAPDASTLTRCCRTAIAAAAPQAPLVVEHTPADS